MIYNECTKRDCDSKMSSEYSIIEKWLITKVKNGKTKTSKNISKTEKNNGEISNPYANSQCEVKFECGILLNDEIKSDNLKENLGLIRTKVLRYCMQNFNEWRLLIKNEYLINFDSMYKFIGNWNKLNSYFHIKIVDNPNQIIYNDGSTFDVNILNNSNILRACYADGYFDAKIAPNSNGNILQWNNGSIWVRNGFEKFCAKYQIISEKAGKFAKENTTMIAIDSEGFINFLSVKNEKNSNNHNHNNNHKQIHSKKKYKKHRKKSDHLQVRFVLTSKDSIMYIRNNHKVSGKGTFINNFIDKIEWSNGDVWQKADPKQNTKNHANDCNHASSLLGPVITGT